MSINPTQAAKAYASAGQQIGKQAEAKSPLQPGKSDFGAMLEDSLNGVLKAGESADAKIIAQAAGKADLVDVVTAVAEAEITLKTLVSVRDRVISAYQDIMKMPI